MGWPSHLCWSPNAPVKEWLSSGPRSPQVHRLLPLKPGGVQILSSRARIQPVYLSYKGDGEEGRPPGRTEIPGGGADLDPP